MSALARVVRVLTYLAGVSLPAGVVLGFAAGWDSTPALIALGVGGASLVGVVAYVMTLKRSTRLYCREIASGLDAAYEATRGRERTFDIGRDKLIVFSDQHKGTRDGADDFWRAERAYCSALAYYLALDYRLMVLGDAEELWETWSPGTVVANHQGGEERALDLEARFQAAGRYDRVWGNHDLNWSRPREVAKHLVDGGPFAEGLEVHEAITFRVCDGERELGRLFFAHGHQGTADSQVITFFSRPFVRFFGFLQRRFKKGWNTPANDWKLRARHDRAMFAWAKSKRDETLVLIAGHTHRPVFWDRQREFPSAQEITALADAVEAAEGADAPKLSDAEKAADLAYAQADRRWGAGSGAPAPEDIVPPSYFNDGCCSFADGDITGLEIEAGEIRLVRWPDDCGRARPERLDGARAPLADVFEAIRTYRGD